MGLHFNFKNKFYSTVFELLSGLYVPPENISRDSMFYKFTGHLLYYCSKKSVDGSSHDSVSLPLVQLLSLGSQ